MISTEDIKARVKSTVLQHGKMWATNAAKNYPYAKNDLTDVPERSARTAVICGAGPSLENAIDELRERRTDFDIFASPTCYSYLRASGVVPDFLVSVDGEAKQGYVLGEHTVDNVPLLACPFTSHNLVKRVKAPIYWFRNHLQGSEETPMLDEFGLNRFMEWQYSHLSSSIIQAGCVTNNIVLIAHHFTREAIAHYEHVYLAGADFGWLADGKTRVDRYRLHAGKWHLDNNAAYMSTNAPREFELEMDGGVRFVSNELHFQYVNSLLFLWTAVLTLFDMQHFTDDPTLLPMPKRSEALPNAQEKAEIVNAWRDKVNEHFEKGADEGESSDVSDS